MKRGPDFNLVIALTSLVVLMTIAAGFVVYRDHHPALRPRDVVFDEWRAIEDEDGRMQLAKEIHRHEHLIGLTSERVFAELGKSNARPMSPEYGDIKYVVGPNLIDHWWLCIHLKDDKVAKTQIRTD